MALVMYILDGVWHLTTIDNRFWQAALEVSGMDCNFAYESVGFDVIYGHISYDFIGFGVM